LKQCVLDDEHTRKDGYEVLANLSERGDKHALSGDRRSLAGARLGAGLGPFGRGRRAPGFVRLNRTRLAGAGMISRA
jgi:hypothetical protein